MSELEEKRRNKKRNSLCCSFFGGDAGFVANIVCVITERKCLHFKAECQPGYRGSRCKATARLLPCKIPASEQKKEQPSLFLFWWRCGDLNPGSSFYTRHLLHAYSVIKFSYRRSPTDGGFEEAENADLLTAVGKSVARSV